MSDFARCKTCGKYDFLSKHNCPPRWECRLKDKFADEIDWCDAFAYDAETAAEDFAEDYDCSGGEYSIVQAGCAEIEVRKPGSSEIAVFAISAETVPQYSAREIPSPHQTPQDQ